MKGWLFSDPGIISILKGNEVGMLVNEVCRSDVIYYKWKSRSGVMAASGLFRIREMEVELNRL